MPVEEPTISEVENTPVNVPTSEFDGLTKSARRRLKRKLVSQSTLNASNSPDTEDEEIIDDLSSTEVCIQLCNILIFLVLIIGYGPKGKVQNTKASLHL